MWERGITLAEAKARLREEWGGMALSLAFEGLMPTALPGAIELTLASLLAAGPLMRLLGARVEAVITRVLGVLLGAMAVQFVIDGLRGAIGLGS